MVPCLVALSLELEGCHDLSKDLKPDNSSSELKVHNPTMEQSEKCCGKHGICSHEILRDEDTDASSKLAGRRVARKVSLGFSCGSSLFSLSLASSGFLPLIFSLYMVILITFYEFAIILQLFSNDR